MRSWKKVAGVFLFNLVVVWAVMEVVLRTFSRLVTGGKHAIVIIFKILCPEKICFNIYINAFRRPPLRLPKYLFRKINHIYLSALDVRIHNAL